MLGSSDGYVFRPAAVDDVARAKARPVKKVSKSVVSRGYFLTANKLYSSVVPTHNFSIICCVMYSTAW